MRRRDDGRRARAGGRAAPVRPQPVRPSRLLEGATVLGGVALAAGEVPDEQHAATHIASGAPDRVETWTVEGAGHTGGLETEPDKWTERVVDFLTETLLTHANPDS